MSDLPVVWSYGGGTQSVAIAVLVSQGELPKPDLVVIADTGREAQETWDYTRDHVDPLLATVGLKVEIAPHSLSTVGLYSDPKPTEEKPDPKPKLLLPVFTGDGGALAGFCSNEWKKRVIQRWCRAQGYGPRNPIAMWLGFSIDEVQRAKPSGVPWMEYQWPLLGMPAAAFPADVARRRDECISLVQRAGLPKPPRSACWMCPYRNNEEWRHLRDNYPDDFQKAVALEKSIQARDRDGAIYLHRQMKNIGEADIDEENADMFGDGCASGHCFV